MPSSVYDSEAYHGCSCSRRLPDHQFFGKSYHLPVRHSFNSSALKQYLPDRELWED